MTEKEKTKATEATEKPQRKPRANVEEVITKALKDGTLDALAKTGATDEQIAEALGISRRSLYRWIKKNPALLEAVNRSHDVIIADLWAGVRDLTKGRLVTLKDKKTRTIRNAKGEITSTSETLIERQVYLPPNLNACEFLLMNYINAKQRGKEGTPQEIVTAPPELPKKEANGRMEELDEALWQLFYGEQEDAEKAN